MSRPTLTRYTLTEVETENRYELSQKGQNWKREFKTVAAAYYFARSQVDSGDGEMLVVDRGGAECTLYLF